MIGTNGAGRKLILVGAAGSRRTEYFSRAASFLGEKIEICPWEKIFSVSEENCRELLEGAVVKLDPPPFSVYELEEMSRFLEEYRDCLNKLSRIDARFLNAPEMIGCMLDKGETKKRLCMAGVPTTELVAERVTEPEQLFRRLKETGIFSVFIKPRFFSGAAGIMALRIHPTDEKMAAYTSVRMERGKLINTKRIRRLQKRDEIFPILEALLTLDCLVERWHPKSILSGSHLVYDLRIVYQFGRMEHVVVRTSKNPITNLHLSDGAVKRERTGLSERQWREVEKLCGSAVKEFSGVSVCGLDVMIDRKGSVHESNPRIIEMNGQGDLIYEDIFLDNKIYRNQIEMLRKQCD